MAAASLTDRIMKAGVLVAAAHLFLKFSGLVLTKVATHYLDAETYECIMVVAFTGIISSMFYVGQELIAPTFLSVFMKEKSAGGERAAWSFANTALTAQLLVLLIAVSLLACFPDAFIRLFTSWSPERNPGAYLLLRKALRLLAPALLFLSLGTTTYSLLNGYKRFFIAAFGDSATKLCVIAGLIVGVGLFGLDYRVLIVGILAGSVAKLVTHLIGLGEKCAFLRPSFSWRNPAFVTLLLLMLPLLFGVLFAKVRDNFNNIYVLTRIETRGILMANDLGRKLFASIQWLVPYSLQIALYPFLCELAGSDDREKLGEILNGSCRMMLALFMPFAAVLSAVAIPLSMVIFIGGKTGAQIAGWAGISTACYCLALPATAVESVLLQGLFACQKTVASTVIGLSTSLISILVSYYFIIVRQVGPEAAILAVSFGFVASRTVKSLVLAVYMGRRLPLFRRGATLLFVLRLLAVTLLSGVASWAVCRFIGPETDRLGLLVQSGGALAAGGFSYLFAAWLLGFQEPRTALEWMLKKVRRKAVKKDG